jgi:uracil-DNA glycosylase family 4
MAVVGEAPGGEELKDGIPFVGPSGQLFESVLPEGFDTNLLALILNAMQCRPGKTATQTKDKELKCACTSACRPRLQEQLWEHPREVILCLGNFGAMAVTGAGDFKITQHRGEVDLLEDPVRGTLVKVVYALHPAYLLRGGGSVKVFGDDIRRAISLAYGDAVAYGDGARIKPPDWVEPEYDILATPAEVHGLCDWIAQQNRVVTITGDYETTSLDCFQELVPETGRPAEPISFGVYGDWDNNVAQIFPWAYMRSPDYAVAVRRLRTLENVRWIFQGGKFDYKFERRDPLLCLPEEELEIHEDTLMLSYALDEASNAHDLDDQAKNWLGAPEHKDMLKPYLPNKSSSYALVPEPVLSDYQARDLKKQYHVWCKTHPRVTGDKDLEKLYTRTLIPSIKFYAELELYGIGVDWNYVRINRSGSTPDDLLSGIVAAPEAGLEQQIEEVAAQINEMAGYPLNPNSPAQVGTWLWDEVGIKLNGKRPPSTDKAIMAKLEEQTRHPALLLVTKYRRLVKMLGTYVSAIERRAVNDRIHTTYKTHRTTTGRPSSTEPNILNIPREARYRRMYRARPGYVLIEGDFNTAELRALAIFSRDAFLLGVFADDKRNLHDEVSIAMYGPDFTEDDRIRAKAVNFGIPYGRSGFTLEFEFDLPRGEGQRMIDAWFARAPQAHEFLQRCEKAAETGKTLTTVFGRKRRPGVVSYDRLPGLRNEFKNFFMQSTVADFTLHAAMRMQPELKRLGGSVVNPVYDANLIEVPDDKGTILRAARLLKDTMEAVPYEWLPSVPIPFRVDLKVGTNWGLLTKWEKWLEKERAQWK